MSIYVTKDTDERVEFNPPPGRLDAEGFSLEGYDWMDAAAKAGWPVMAGWGADGWDCGEWPYVQLALAKGQDENGTFFGMTTYCEGDTTTSFYRTQAAQWDAISRWCHWNWVHGQGDGPTGLPKDFDECGPEIRRPFGEQYDAVYAAMVAQP